MRLFGSAIRPAGRCLARGSHGRPARYTRVTRTAAQTLAGLLLCVTGAGGCADDTWLADAHDSTREAGVAERVSATDGRSAARTRADASAADWDPAQTTVIPCGTAKCLSPVNVFGVFPVAACCADEDTSTCGLITGNDVCMRPFVGDARCPPLTFRGIISVPSCCNESGACGLDASMYGLPGCIELARAATLASGVPGISIPEPRSCSAHTATGADAGDADAGL